MRENTSHKIQDLVANSGKFGKLGFDCSICEQEFDDLESLNTHSKVYCENLSSIGNQEPCQELLSKHAAPAIIKKNNHWHSLHFVDFLWLNKSDLQYQGEFWTALGKSFPMMVLILSFDNLEAEI